MGGAALGGGNLRLFFYYGIFEFMGGRSETDEAIK